MSKEKKASNGHKPDTSENVRGVDPTNRSFEVLRFAYGKATNVVTFKETAYDFAIKDVGSVKNEFDRI